MINTTDIAQSPQEINDILHEQLNDLGYSVSQITAITSKKNAEIIVAKLIELHPLLLKSFNREEITLFATRSDGIKNLKDVAALIRSGLVLYNSTRKALNDLFQRNQCHIAQDLIAEKIREHQEDNGVEEIITEPRFVSGTKNAKQKSVVTSALARSSADITESPIQEQPNIKKRRLLLDTVLDGRRVNFRFPDRFFASAANGDNRRDGEESTYSYQ